MKRAATHYMSSITRPASPTSRRNYNRFLLLVAGLGGLLYGVDVGIIAGALPYLTATSNLTAGKISSIVAAVLLGSAISTLFAGYWPIGWPQTFNDSERSAFCHQHTDDCAVAGYGPLVMGRLLQGMSAGLIGVVVPLYLAECLARRIGQRHGIFQWLLVLGLVAAAIIAMYFSIRWMRWPSWETRPSFCFRGQGVARDILGVAAPGVLFVIGSLMVAESPRWLFRRGKREAARAALLRSRDEEQARVELQEMEAVTAEEKAKSSPTGRQVKDSLFSRKYVIPFVLACIILACNQATGINSIIQYNTIFSCRAACPTCKRIGAA